MKTATFCGHRDAPDPLEGVLAEEVERLIEKEGVCRFYVGNQGGFDGLALKVVRQAAKKHKTISYSVVLAYHPQERDRDFCAQNPTIYPSGLESVPMRFAILHRNRWMIDHADVLVSFVKRPYGGAYIALRYAQKQKNISIVHLMP